MRPQQRLIEHEQRNHVVAFLAGCGQGRVILQSQITSEPDNAAHQDDSWEATLPDGSCPSGSNRAPIPELAFSIPIGPTPLWGPLAPSNVSPDHSMIER